MSAVSSWSRHRGSTSSIVSIVFANNQDDDEQLYVARWPKFFPAPESAASVPEADAPSKKRAANAVATLESRGGQSTKTRRGMAAAGEQPTVATTGRMLLVEDTEDGTSPSKRTWAAREQRPEPKQLTGEAETGGARTCRGRECGGTYTGSRRDVCPHCGWQAGQSRAEKLPGCDFLAKRGELTSYQDVISWRSGES